MDARQGLGTQVEPAEVGALRRGSAEVLERLATVAGEKRGAALPLIGLPALGLQLKRIAPAATSTSWVLQPRYAYDPEDPGVALTRSARGRGVETELVTLPSSAETHP